MFVATLLVGALAGLMARWLWSLWNEKQIFSRQGLPGPKPNFFLGNFLDIAKKGYHPCLELWTKEYGKTFGFFSNEGPVLVTSDVDLLKKVFVSHFQNFMNRTPIPFLSERDPYINMFRANNQRWKKLRHGSTPAFSNSKIKHLAPVLNDVVRNNIKKIQAASEGEKAVEVYGHFQDLTLDIIGNVAFGINLGGSEDVTKSQFRMECQKAVDVDNMGCYTWFWIIISLFLPTFTTWVMDNCRFLNPFQMNYLLEAARVIIEQRKVDPSVRREDFIQFMIEHGKGTEEELTLEEMQGNSLLFIIAGHETTATTLAFASYELALHENIQTELQQEIDEVFPGENPTVTAEDMEKLPFLDMVVQETLRLHPIGAFATERVVGSDVTLDGVHFPKGIKVQANMKAVHLNADLWGPEDTSHFVPERFAPEQTKGRHPLAFLPFGAGPRNCIGWRFALLEAKIALIHLMKNFNFRRCPETKVPLDISPMFIERPNSGVYLNLLPRV